LSGTRGRYIEDCGCRSISHIVISTCPGTPILSPTALVLPARTDWARALQRSNSIAGFCPREAFSRRSLIRFRTANRQSPGRASSRMRIQRTSCPSVNTTKANLRSSNPRSTCGPPRNR
jgi:hypothetical protein